MKTLIMVLNDGETFTDVEGCYIMAVDGEIEDIERQIADAGADEYVARFSAEDNQVRAATPGGAILLSHTVRES